MKILHTSDWHLGKLFHEKSMLEDQAYMLNQIFNLLKEADEKGAAYQALVVSGDIYDRAMPPSEAVTLLNSFLVSLTEELPDLHVFMNSGNHDSASRLAYAAEFLELHNIHICTNTKNFTKPVILGHEEKVAFYQLPFLTPLSISQESDSSESESHPLRSQQELYQAATSQILKAHKKNYGDMPALLNAHLFAAGSSTASSERSNVGTAEQVDISLFKDFTYGAFGHIHKFQACDKEKHLYYPGALLAYNFDDNPENGLLEVEISCQGEASNAGVNVKHIPLEPLHPIARVKAKMSQLIGSDADMEIIRENLNKYVQVILTDPVMPTEAFSTLKTVFPNLLSVTSQEGIKGGQSETIQERKEAILSNDPEKIFLQFMKDAGGECEDEELFLRQKEIFVSEAAKSYGERGE
ncbi:MAG: exonuclease SbcCD subunit D C-terminal domain-containing protein [Treponema sp.]|nr:exonuclease SbcCD subunit D C-terminal domain-containing protein [Treponema sp.]